MPYQLREYTIEKTNSRLSLSFVNSHTIVNRTSESNRIHITHNDRDIIGEGSRISLFTV
jgi:hypothetical protein